MLSKISQTGEKILYDYLEQSYSQKQKVESCWQELGKEGKGNLLFNGYGVLDWEGEMLRRDDGDNCIVM